MESNCGLSLGPYKEGMQTLPSPPPTRRKLSQLQFSWLPTHFLAADINQFGSGTFMTWSPPTSVTLRTKFSAHNPWGNQLHSARGQVYDSFWINFWFFFISCVGLIILAPFIGKTVLSPMSHLCVCQRSVVCTCLSLFVDCFLLHWTVHMHSCCASVLSNANV